MWPLDGKKTKSMPGGEEAFTFLGKGAMFKGIITFDSEIRIDARIEGEIHTKGTLIVGEHGIIDGDIIAAVVINGGRITGNVIASEKVQLLAPGVLIGTIKTPLLSMEEGARFRGTCEVEGRGEVKMLEGPGQAAAQGEMPQAHE